jgi:hypothetical protein
VLAFAVIRLLAPNEVISPRNEMPSGTETCSPAPSILKRGALEEVVIPFQSAPMRSAWIIKLSPDVRVIPVNVVINVVPSYQSVPFQV